MKYPYPTALTFLTALTFGLGAAAQGDTVYYTGFAESLGEWTVEDLSSTASGDRWVWSDVSSGGQFTLPAIRSTSGPNGFALFDSDLQCSGSQNSRLRSPVLDLSDVDEVEVRWQHLYRRFQSAIYLEVSVDAGRTYATVELVPQLPEDAYVGTADGTAMRASFDLSEVAAGEDSVVIAYRYYSEPAVFGAEAGCGYAWMVDDVAVASSVAPPPAVDLDFVAVAPPANFASPAGRGVALHWAAELANRGSESQTASVEVRVTPTGGEAELFTGTSASFELAPGEVAAMPSLDSFPLPENPGDYTATYSIVGVAGDASPAGNERSFRFVVTDSTYRKVPGVTTFARPRGDASYSAGTVFDLGGARARLDSVSFAVEVEGTPATSGATLTLSTFAYLGDLDGDGELSIGTELVELATRAVPVSEITLGDAVRTTVAPTQDGRPLELDEEVDQIAVLVTVPRSDSAASTRVDLGFYAEGGSYDFSYRDRAFGGAAPSALSRTGDEGLRAGVDAFGGLVPDIAVTVGAPMSVGAEEVAARLSHRIYPNPASSALRVELVGGAESEVWRVELIDGVGRVWVEEQTRTGRVDWDLQRVPPGVYTVRARGDGAGNMGIQASVIVHR